MKIYTQDWSWAGSIVVIASSEAEAREKMAKVGHNYDKDQPIEAHEITPDFVFFNLGDS